MWEANTLGTAVHDMSNPSPINFTRGVPTSDSFPTEDLVAASATALRSQAETVLQYGSALGFRPLREWLAAWQKTEVDAVLTGNGSLQLIDFLCLHLLSPGDVVFTESPTYDRTITLLRRHGAKIVGIPLEADGPDIPSLERALARQVPKLFYVIPDFQNPAGATCSGEKRRRIAELARCFGFLLVEDAPYRLLRYRGREEPTLRELAPEQTVHLSSFTKLIAPGIRLGFLVGSPALIAKLAKIAEDTYISAGYLAQATAFEYCRHGLLPGQIDRLKMLYAPRLDACLGAIDRFMPETATTRPDGGFFVSITLPPGIGTTAVREAAAKRALNLADGLAFFPEGGGERFLRLPFCALTPAEIEEGIRRLAGSVADVRRAA